MKRRFLLDTSCMVAAVCSWHADHEATAAEISRRLSAGEKLVTAASALVEAYAVLTRLPAPHRLSAADALTLLDANFMGPGHVVSLNSQSYVRLLRHAPALEIRGGNTYDAVIASCALQARAGALLTLNEVHFKIWESSRLKIVVPIAGTRSLRG